MTYRTTIAILTLATLPALPAGAQENKVLTVYTYESFDAEWGPGPVVKKAFEQTCGCKLKFVSVEDGVALLNRLKLEGQSSPADIVLGLDNNLIHEAKETGFFAQSGVSTEAADIPGGERPMLGFETLTVAPIHKGLIDTHLLTADELAWLDSYHAMVRQRVLPLVSGDVADWLLKATEPLAGATP